MAVKISVEPSHMTLHEPVVLELTLTNDEGAPAHVDLGRDRKAGLLITVTSPSGRKSPLSWPRRNGFTRRGDFTLEPNAEYAQRYVLNEVYDFNETGLYELEVILANPILIKGAVPRGQDYLHATIELKPRNDVALRARCESILDQAEHSSSYTRAAENALALSYVQDPVAVPYLQHLLGQNKLVQPIVINGLERIATPEAVRALASVLTENEDADSLLARAALSRIENETSNPEVKKEIGHALNEEAP